MQWFIEAYFRCEKTDSIDMTVEISSGLQKFHQSQPPEQKLVIFETFMYPTIGPFLPVFLYL